MTRMFRILLFLTCLSISAWAQQNPWFDFLPQLRQWLELTDGQATAIVQNNEQYYLWLIGKQTRIAQVQSELTAETAKQTLDPLALGVRYAEIEGICREIADRGASLRKQNTEALTEPQKAKLKTLEDAVKLLPLIAEAQSGNLLSGLQIGQTSRTDRFSRTDGTRLGFSGPSIAGCVGPSQWINTPQFRPAGAENGRQRSTLPAQVREDVTEAHALEAVN